MPNTNTTPPSPPTRKRRRALLFVAWTAIGSAVLLEAALRVFDPFGVGYFWAMRRYGHILVPHPKYAYDHQPGFRGSLQGVEVAINSEGLRWPEFQTAKPKAATRVMFLGDSVVFGWGAKLETTFPMLVQKALRQTNPRVEVIAAGACSWNTRCELEFMKAKGFGYGPNVLVLVVYDNDIDPKKADGATHAQVVDQPRRSLLRRVVRALGQHSYLVATALAIRGKLAAGQRPAKLYADDSPLWQHAKAALEELIRLCRERHVALVAYLDGNTNLPFTQACFEQYGRVFDAAGVHVVKAKPEYYQPRYCNSWVDGHGNAARHRLVAKALLKVITPLVQKKARKTPGRARDHG